MDAKRISIMAGGAAAFVAVVVAGAFAIVSLSPAEQRPLAVAQQGLLIEGTTALKPFDSGSSSGAPPRQSAAPPRALTALREPALPRAALPPPVVEAPAPIEPEPEAPPPEVRVKPVPKETPRAEPPPRAEPKPPRPAAPAVQAALPSAQPRPPEGLLTPVEIRRFRLSLRLTREQEPYWIPVEQALLEISAQQSAMVRAGQNPKDAFGIGAGMRMYSVARPLLDQLREDQKVQVRARARAMGFGSIASSI